MSCRHVVVNYKPSSLQDDIDGSGIGRLRIEEVKEERVLNLTCGCFAPIPLWYQRFFERLGIICMRRHYDETQSKKNCKEL